MLSKYRRLSVNSYIAFMFFLLTGFCCYGQENERPNILFLVIEDTSPYLLPAYGNKEIKTPNIDFLAKNGVVFNNAFSNAPYCSPARSSLISGSYATTYGSDWHRNPMVVPQEYFFPQYLRQAGYFTVNAGKTDYNVTKDVQRQYYGLTWDKLSGYAGKSPNATYNDPEREDRPFFAQFNNHTTHMSRMTSVSTDYRDPLKIDSSRIQIPPHVPDLPEIRADYALHLEGVVDADQWVGHFLQDLRNRDLLENTIIFFFSDHGGCLPRGKAFPFESGMKAGLIVYAPDKWQHLLPGNSGSHTDSLVEFVDFGPTLLSLAGEDIPAHMQGVPFMGDHAVESRKYSFGFRTNSEDHFDPSRTVSDGRFLYIKNYTPYKRHGLKQSFQWGMPAQQAWDEYYLSGEAIEQFQAYYEVKPQESLFDMRNDPFSVKDLAEDPLYQAKLEELRSQLKTHISTTKDLGFFPRDVRDGFTSEGISLYEWTRETGYPFKLLYELVDKASTADKKNRPYFEKLLKHERPEIRFWAASGIAYLAKQKITMKAENALFSLLKQEKFESVKAITAEALVYHGNEKGLDALIDESFNHNTFAISSLENIKELAAPVLDEIEKLAENSKNGRIRFQARSILIDLGKMDMKNLFEPNQIERFLKGHYDRVSNGSPSLPN